MPNGIVVVPLSLMLNNGKINERFKICNAYYLNNFIHLIIMPTKGWKDIYICLGLLHAFLFVVDAG